MSFGFFTHNIDLGVTGPCTWIPPDPDVPIIAETLYVGPSALSPSRDGHYHTGQLAVSGDNIIVHGLNRLIALSTNGGDDFTEYPSTLPDDPSYITKAGSWLTPTNWQFFNGTWYSHMNQVRPDATNLSNNDAYVVSISGITPTEITWNVTFYTYSDGNGDLRDFQGNGNGRYTANAMVWLDNGNLVADGRWCNSRNVANQGQTPPSGDENDLTIVRYDTPEGSSARSGWAGLLDWGSARYNQNSTQLSPLREGFFRARWSGSNMRFDSVNDSLDTDYSNLAFAYVEPWDGRNYFSSGNDVVLITPRGNISGIPAKTVFNVWQKGASSPLMPYEIIPNISPGTTSYPHAVYSPLTGQWVVNSISAGSSEAYSSYATQEDLSDMVVGPQIVLPFQTRINSSYRFHRSYYVGGTTYIGFYNRESDNAIVVFRYTYGSLTGDCA